MLVPRERSLVSIACEIVNGGSSFLIFSLVSNTVDTIIFFLPTSLISLYSRFYFGILHLHLDIISFLPQQSGNRLSDSWLDKSYDSHSIEGEERKRAEYGCSN